MRKQIEKAVIIVLSALVVLGTHLYITFFTPASAGDKSIQTIYIPKGTSFRVVAASLERSGIIRDSGTLERAASFLGAYKKIKAGEYELSSSMTPVEILNILVEGRVKKYLVTIPEGFNIKEIAATLNAAGLVETDEFLEKAMDRAYVQRLGFSGQTLEGYLFPDTYIFTKGMSVDEMISKMAGRFRSVYQSEFEELARRKKMPIEKLLTLASIIEKETGVADERPLISSVFHNRLKKGIRLQSDPTVIYGLKDFNGNLTRTHLRTKTPYNTYMNYGLPPGPIANPGKEAIRAALNPTDGDYLYFVSRNDGTHYFSRSLKEHNKAVDEFQRKRLAQKKANG